MPWTATLAKQAESDGNRIAAITFTDGTYTQIARIPITEDKDQTWFNSYMSANLARLETMETVYGGITEGLYVES